MPTMYRVCLSACFCDRALVWPESILPVPSYPTTLLLAAPTAAETIEAYVEIVNTAPAQPAPGSPTEQAVLQRQAEFDR